MNRVFLGNPMQGSVLINGAVIAGTFTPTIFRTNTSLFGAIPSQNVLGVIHKVGNQETEYVLHVVSRAFGDAMSVLGPRWVAFISALMSTNQTVTDELAREAWFATNREPNDFLRGTVERGHASMKALLPEELVESIRSMAPGSQA